VVILITLVTTLVTPLLLKITYLIPSGQESLNLYLSTDDPLLVPDEQFATNPAVAALQEESHVS
jgi:hypothetical protein